MYGGLKRCFFFKVGSSYTRTSHSAPFDALKAEGMSTLSYTAVLAWSFIS